MAVYRNTPQISPNKFSFFSPPCLQRVFHQKKRKLLFIYIQNHRLGIVWINYKIIELGIIN